MANGNVGRAFLFLLLDVSLWLPWGPVSMVVSFQNDGLDASLVDVVTSDGRVPVVPADLDRLLSAPVVEERAGA